MSKQKIDRPAVDRRIFSDRLKAFGVLDAGRNLAKGYGGSELSHAEFYESALPEETDSNYLIDQGPDTSDSELAIGPLRYTCSVQNIDIFEERAVISPASTRSDRPVAIDSGQPYQKANIRFLFSGIKEINEHLRPLIALFRICPIVSIHNEMLSTAWAPRTPALLDTLNNNFANISLQHEDDRESLNQTLEDAKQLIKEGRDPNLAISSAYNTKYKDVELRQKIQAILTDVLFTIPAYRLVPVCLEALHIETIPELPTTISVSLTLSHIDASSISEFGELEYLGNGPESHHVDPKRAHYLKKYLRRLLNNDLMAFPVISEESFGEVEFKFFDKAISRVQPLSSIPAPVRFTTDGLHTKVVGLSATIAHRFAYHRLIGRSQPCPQHMGISSRSLSLNIDFSDNDSMLEQFSQFKELSDKFLRIESIIDRVMGWEIINPLTKLLGSHINTEYIEELNGVFTPITIQMSNGDTPRTKSCAVTLLETNVNFLNTTQILLDSGGADIDNLKKLLGIIIDNDYQYRLNPTTDIKKDPVEISAHYALFPRDNNGLEGIINRDSLRAVLFNSNVLANSVAFRSAMLKLPIATGKVIDSNIKVHGWGLFFKGLWEIGIRTPTELGALDIEREAVAVVRELFDDIPIATNEADNEPIFGLGISDVELTEIAALIVLGMLGQPGWVNDAINRIKGSNLKFSKKFKDALYETIIYRLPPMGLLSKSYDKEGLYLGFNILYLEYLDSKRLYPQFDKGPDYNPRGTSVWRQSTYLDFRLPTYRDLFGANWRFFAPTYDDIGINYFSDRGVSRPINTANSEDLQSVLAVNGEDIVPPFIWFYTKRMKGELRKEIRDGSGGYLSLGSKRWLSMNLRSVKQYNTLKNIGENRQEELRALVNAKRLDDPSVNGIAETLVELITQSYTDDYGRFDTNRFLEDIEATRDLVDLGEEYIAKDTKKVATKVFYDKYLDPKSPTKISLYFTTTGLDMSTKGGHISNRLQVSPLAGAAFIRVLQEEKYLIKKLNSLGQYNTPAQDENLTTVGSGTIDAQNRNLRKHTEDTVKNSISQIPDDYNSPSKLFPAAKVYFLERRGNDLIADDVYFSTDAIISIDITDDKDDPPLAVIKIADPLRFIQDSSFGSSNIASQKVNTPDGDSLRTVVLANKRKTSEGLLKQRKIEQGRAIQIRMGYGANPDHLPIIFTGRITEIEPGDELTIVAQGWKAELVNRQVNFYSSNSKSWGAKDLAIQALQQADPDGLGSYIPDREARAILSRLGATQEGVRRQILNNQKNQILQHGYDTIGTDLTQLLQLDTVDIYTPATNKPGLDTRLKNIWYPDMSTTINNFFKWRQITGIHGPDFINDYWLVPLQPAWNVMKEAARHTWNYIVQVVPYDGEATLFFGHPDQLYYFTRGNRNKLDEWKKYSTAALNDKNFNDKLQNLIEEFYRWNDRNPYGFLPPDQEEVINLGPLEKGVFPHSYTQLVGVINNSNRAQARRAIEASGIPLVKLHEIDAVIDGKSIPILLYLFYGFKPNRLQSQWPGYEQAILNLLKPLETEGAANVYRESLPVDVRTIDLLQDTNFLLDTPRANIEQAISLLQTALKIFKTNDTGDFELPVVRSLLFPNHQIVSGEIGSLMDELHTKMGIKFIPSLRLEGHGRTVTYIKDKSAISSMEYLIHILRNQISVFELGPIANIYKVDTNQTVKQLFESSDFLFKAFIYYFGQFLQETNIKEKLIELNKTVNSSINQPNMRVFRVHHYVDSAKDILVNDIVATTSQMWNTVVVNHPSENPADTTVNDGTVLHVGSQVKTTVSWQYWPKPIVSRVVGLQFHPGLSLANKKIKLCTELNCITPELAAKLACNNLADGIKRMYRGHLTIRGRNIKPYDRIILNDTFTGMKGPLEVESLVHHFSVDTGWITNIIPEAVCDSNPGAAVIQTAILEKAFERVFNIGGAVFDGFLLGSILFAPGVGTALKGVVKGAVSILPGLSLKGLFTVAQRTVVSAAEGLKAAGYNPAALSAKAIERYQPVITRLFRAYAANQALGSFLQHTQNFMMAAAWVEGAQDNKKVAAQLPVILCPLIYNGSPWTAGLEADDIMFSVPFYDTYYSLHDFKTAVQDYLGAANR